MTTEALPPDGEGTVVASAAKRRLPAASLRSAEIGRAADAAQARASPASLTDGEDAVGTSRASARRTSSPVVGIFRRLASLGVFPVAFFSSLSSCVFCVFFPIGLIGLIGLIIPIGLIAPGFLRKISGAAVAALFESLLG